MLPRLAFGLWLAFAFGVVAVPAPARAADADPAAEMCESAIAAGARRGGVCNALAVAYPNLAASVPYYGRQADAADVPAIQAPLQLHYAGLDERVNAGWPPYEAALKANGKTFEAHFYTGANHGFHNDTTPRYDPAAAALAWARTLDFFGRHLTSAA